MSVSPPLAASERAFLLGLQRQALRYFLENQTPGGLIRDRQINHGPLSPRGWCSTCATGMGLIAVSLAAAPPYRMLSRDEAAGRVRTALDTALERLPTDHGIMPHFLDSATDEARGHDVFSTVDSSWLLAGGLWAARFLGDATLEKKAGQLYDRVDWLYWTDPDNSEGGLLRHGKGTDGRFLPIFWNRLNGETVFMYVLGAGAAPERAIPPKAWSALKPFYGTVAGLRFNNADLGLFTFEYGLDLLDLRCWRRPARWIWRPKQSSPRGPTTYSVKRKPPISPPIAASGACPTETGRATRRSATRTGRGPGKPIDGTAQIIDTLAAVANAPDEVMENLHRADSDTELGSRGRYGFSPVNLDHGWVGQSIVGIDAGAAVMAVDNYLFSNRVRRVFHSLPCVRQGMQRLGFTQLEKVAPALGVVDEP